MLIAKYYKQFKGCENCILIVGNTEDYKNTSSYLSGIEATEFSFSDYIEIENIKEIPDNKLLLTDEDIKSLLNIFGQIIITTAASHYYFEAKNIRDIEFLISSNEYKDIP